MFNHFFIWCNKHDFFMSGLVVSLNLVASIQSFKDGDTSWGWTNLTIAILLWLFYITNVNKEEPK